MICKKVINSTRTCGAEPLLGSVENLVVPLDRHAVVEKGQVGGLVVVVVGPRQRHGRQEVEGDLVVGLRVVDLLGFRRRLQILVISLWKVIVFMCL